MHQMPVDRELELVGKGLDVISPIVFARFRVFLFRVLNRLEGSLSLHKERARARKGDCPLLMHKSCNTGKKMPVLHDLCEFIFTYRTIPCNLLFE
jgi:hypothetical protein